MSVEDIICTLSTLMDIELTNKKLLEKLMPAAIKSAITNDIDDEWRYITLESEYARGEWAASCIREEFLGEGW